MKKLILFLLGVLSLSSFTRMPDGGNLIVIPPIEIYETPFFDIMPSSKMGRSTPPFAFFAKKNLAVKETIDTIFESSS